MNVVAASGIETGVFPCEIVSVVAASGTEAAVSANETALAGLPVGVGIAILVWVAGTVIELEDMIV